QQLPRLFLEFLAVLGLVALVLLMLWEGKPLDTLLPTLGLFAAAAFRLIPSINRILNAVQGLRFALPMLELLNNELSFLDSENTEARPHRCEFMTEFRLEKVSFQYPSSENLALVDVSFTIPSGASVGFIGESGAGKTTIVDIILGLITPDKGVVEVDGVNIQNNLRGWQDQIGYVPQTIFLTDDTLRRNIAFGLPNEQIDDARISRALKLAQLERFVKGLPEGLETMVGEFGVRLSGGQRQRIGIARALYHDPEVLVLDEATSSLDTKTEREVMDAVRELKGSKTLIIIAHRLSTVEKCDYLFKIEQGVLVDQGEATVVLSGRR
ncbi:MAG: ATP-binding cassette domain-containing protein, partial [Candidatus Thioglobus sp.]